MKLLGIYLYDYLQFKDIELNFTYPAGHEKAGQALDKVCFIGRNGTGKSNLLNLLQGNLGSLLLPHHNVVVNGIFKIEVDGKYLHVLRILAWEGRVFDDRIFSKKSGWKKSLFQKYKDNPHEIERDYPELGSLDQNQFEDLKKQLHFKGNSSDLLTYVPSESNQNLYGQITDVPNTTLNDALKLFNQFPFHHIISPDTIKNFWDVLIYQIKKRENDLRDFQMLDENLDKTVREVQEFFDKDHPKILDALAKIWNKILDKANLEFDSKSADNPIQLTDNLKAYIKFKNSDKKIAYNQLSSGIRNYIFKLGHIFTLYFNRNITNGVLLIDEPENELYPDFLYDLIETYTDIAKNTQLFVATHSPIIAAQFEPYERIILDFDEQGHVFAKSGETPVGDDPNDLLVKDFGVRNLYGKEGIKNWERYLKLKLQISTTLDPEEKSILLDEFIEIGNLYNFPKHAVSN